MSAEGPVRPPEGELIAMTAAMTKHEEASRIPVTEPLSQIPGLPDYFPSAQLPPGTYMAPGLDPELEEEELDDERRKLRNLGFGQAVSGICSASFGLIIIFISKWNLSFPILLGTPWWTGVLATVAGLMALAVRRTANKSMTIACLVANVLCALACTPAVLLYSLNIRFYPCIGYCYINCRARIISAITIALLLNCLVSLVMSIAIAIMNCRNIHCCTVEAATTMIVVHANQMAPANLCPHFTGKPGLKALEEPRAIYNVPV
ncbi:membrane-spanning 4-domains subfamily A member 5-like [Scyliorhinus torazame]